MPKYTRDYESLVYDRTEHTFKFNTNAFNKDCSVIAANMTKTLKETAFIKDFYISCSKQNQTIKILVEPRSEKSFSQKDCDDVAEIILKNFKHKLQKQEPLPSQQVKKRMRDDELYHHFFGKPLSELPPAEVEKMIETLRPNKR